MSAGMISVTSLNTKIKSLLEATFMHILVEGEVASVTYHSSGHLYFTIKDKESAIKCVMWRSAVKKLKFKLEQGMHIIVDGSVGVYTPRGEYQFYAVHIEPYGQGVLALAYEQLKEKLKAKGYFDIARKKGLPKYPEKIALVTAKNSAALQDMLKVIQKRWPIVEVSVVDTLVQGDEAAIQIANALHYADTLQADIVVVGRGGGSAEDLWCFNEEVVADTIYSMHTPVISAVGHEVDVMISDFVADLRAPTPSAAIEMIVPDMHEILYSLDEMNERMKIIIQRDIRKCEDSLQATTDLLKRSSPGRKLQAVQEAFSILQEEYQRQMGFRLEVFEKLLPKELENLSYGMEFIFLHKEQSITQMVKQFELNDPKLKVKEGWTQVYKDGKRISLKQIQVQEHFQLEDADTKIEAVCLDKQQHLP